ncbi:MAG: hypothetical protein NVSMB4_20010 [Acidimicrobiales bacterium]
MSNITYYSGGYNAGAAQQNMRERWDDATSTYTSWDTSGVQTSTRPYTAAETAAATAAKAQSAQLTSLEARVKALETLVFKANTPPAAAAWVQPTGAQDAYRPGAHVLWNGAEDRNDSGAWLTADPTAYPQGWTNLTTAPTGAWAAGISVTVGQVYTYGGASWKVIQAHTTQVGWEPPNVASLWSKV